MKKKSKYFLIALFWLAVWQLAALIVGSSLLLPGPIECIKALFVLLTEKSFYLDAGATLLRCIAAIILALVFGLLLAIVSYRHALIRDIISLPVAFFKAVPVMAIAIYVLLLMSAGSVPVLVCWIMCFPIVYTNLLSGLDNMDKELLEMAYMYQISESRTIKYVYLPAMFPYFRSAMSIISGMSWKAIVTAEVLSIPRFSLGYELMNAKYYLNTDVLFAYVAAIIFMSVLFEKLIARAMRQLSPGPYSYSKLGKASASTALAKAGEHSASLNDNRAEIVALEDVSKSYGEKTVLKDIKLKLNAGSRTAIMGASGSGKTTLARIIAGMEAADSGTVVNASNKTAYLFQEYRLLPWLNVIDNLAIAAEEGFGESELREILDKLGLSEAVYKLPEQLSGGMKQRLALARAFVFGGDLLIADEPFNGIDEDTRAAVIENLWKPMIEAKTLIVITHSEKDAAELTDNVVQLSDNKISYEKVN